MSQTIETNPATNWRASLRDDFITMLTGNGIEQYDACVRVGRFYMCKAPTSLYKYYPDKTRNLEAVENGKLWFSAPCNYNDVFDCDISVDDQQIINDIMHIEPVPAVGNPEWEQRNNAIRHELDVFRSIFDSFKFSTGVVCLSEDDDSLLMWAHYANNHHGFCVEYNLSSIWTQLKYTPIPVVYSDRRACFTFSDAETAGNDATKSLIDSLTSKSKEWAYEQEWRIIREKEACVDRWDETNHGALLDMIPPSAIILGCAVSDEFEKSVRIYCETNKINLYKMEKDPGQYRLNKRPILTFDV